MVRALLAAGADVKAERKDGRNALMSAAMMGWTEVVEMLLIDYVDRASHAEIVQILLKHGSKRPTGHSGRTVCDARARLVKLGYDFAPVDCIAGTCFARALADFQRKHSLDATGTLDTNTLRLLVVE
jgi:hypothetical protein